MQLNLKDREIIYNLDFNARMPLAKLAKKLRISKQVAKYRLENLEKNEVIQGFYTDINPSKLGYSIYLVYLKMQNTNPTVMKNFIEHISKQNNVGVNATLNGIWDYCLGIWAEDAIKFEDAYQKIMSKYEKYVKSKTIMIETRFYYFKPKQILEKVSEDQIEMKGDLETVPLDEIDKTILTALSENCRTSLVYISKKIGSTTITAKAHIKKMEKLNLILGYRIMINYQLLDLIHYRLFLHLENITREKETKIMNFLKYERSVVSVTKTIGYCELEFRCLVKNVNELYELMEKLKMNFQEITSYDSIIYHKFHQSLNYFPFK